MAYDWHPVGKLPKIVSQQHSIAIFTDVPSLVTERQMFNQKTFHNHHDYQSKTKLRYRRPKHQ